MIKLLTYSLIKSETGPMHALGADLEKFQSTHSYRVRQVKLSFGGVKFEFQSTHS